MSRFSTSSHFDPIVLAWSTSGQSWAHILEAPGHGHCHLRFVKSNIYWMHELRQMQISHIEINSSYNAVVLTKHHPIRVCGSTEHDGPICFPCHYPHWECLSRSILISVFLEMKYSQKPNLFLVMLRLSTLKNYTHSWAPSVIICDCNADYIVTLYG